MELWLDRTARERPHAIALAPDLTYAELDARATAKAEALAAEGVGAGDLVTTLLPAGPEFAALLHALPKLGAALVPLNPRWTDRERREALAALQSHRTSRTTRSGARSGTFGVDGGAVHCVIFTSGTTGRPKAVELTYRHHEASAAAVAAAFRVTPATRWLCALPLFHIGGLSILIRAAIGGFAVHLHDGFDVQAVKAELEAGAVTHVSLVPTMLGRLRDAGLARAPGVEHVILGGGPMPPELLAWAHDLRLPVTATYGMTETASMVATADGPLPGVEMAVTDDGELLVRGPMVAAEGWLHTGDRGTLGPAGLHVEGRIADTIVTGGENVSAREVEEALLAHPAVRDAAVAGRPDPEWGQAVVAWVVTDGDPDLAGHCRERLAPFKVPKRFLRVDALPRNAAGKVLKGRLP